MRVIVTRPLQEACAWVDHLQQAGFGAMALPLIDVLPAPDPQSVVQAWQRMAEFDALMFVSGNAVDYFFALKPDGVNAFNQQAAASPLAFVTGPGSYAALTQRAGAQPAYICVPDASAGQFDSEALWSVVGDRIVGGYKVLIVRGAGAGRDWFGRQVLQAGGEVDYVLAYQRKSPDFSVEPAALALAQALATQGAVWLFSSSEAIENLVRACPTQKWHDARAIVTHDRIGQTASQAGFGRVMASRPVLADVIACIQTLQ